MPDIKDVNVASLFEGQDGTFEVPPYQRLYAWDESDVEALFDDLTEFATSGESEYILGQIIVAPNSGHRNYKWAIVDGQQRLTSLYLFAYALLNRMRDYNEAGVPGSAAQTAVLQLQNLVFAANNQSGLNFNRLLVGEMGREYVDRILNEESFAGMVDSNDTQINIRQNFEYLKAMVHAKFLELPELCEFVNKFLFSVYIIRVRIASEHQALDLFEKINSRGRPLNSADLLKNLMFEYVDDSDYSRLSNTWDRAVSDVFKVRPAKAASMQFLMKSILGVRTGEGVSNNAVYAKWRDRFRSGEEDAIQFEQELGKSASYLKDVSASQIGALNSHFLGTKYFNTVQHLPLALAVQHLEGNEALLHGAQRVIDARIVLSLLGQEKSQTLESRIWPWAHKLSTLDVNSSLDELIEASVEALADVPVLLETAQLHFHNLRYSSRRDLKRIRYILAACEDYSHGVLAGEVENPNYFAGLVFPARGQQFHVDHVFPKSLIDPNDIDLDAGQDWVHAPGNLCLLHPSDNQAAGAARPAAKSADYSVSQNVLTKFLAGPEHEAGFNDRMRRATQAARALGVEGVTQDWDATTARNNAKGYWALFEKWIRSELNGGRQL